MPPLPSILPQHSQPTEFSEFELEWSSAADMREGGTLSSVERYRRAVVAGGGTVQRCDVEVAEQAPDRRVARMTIHCGNAMLATLQYDMLFDDAISLHSVRRLDATQGAASRQRAVKALDEVVEKRIAELPGSDPPDAVMSVTSLRLMGAREVGLRLGNVSDQTVRIRERSGKLFSVMRPNRLRGREYPEYQLDHGIHGRPLTSLLRILGKAGGDVVHVFFITRTPDLDGLSALEVLRGAAFADGPNTPLLAQPREQRLSAVLTAAERFLRVHATDDSPSVELRDTETIRQPHQPSSTLAR